MLSTPHFTQLILFSSSALSEYISYQKDSRNIIVFSCPSLWIKYFLFAFDSFPIVFSLTFPYLWLEKKKCYFSTCRKFQRSLDCFYKCWCKSQWYKIYTWEVAGGICYVVCSSCAVRHLCPTEVLMQHRWTKTKTIFATETSKTLLSPMERARWFWTADKFLAGLPLKIWCKLEKGKPLWIQWRPKW